MSFIPPGDVPTPEAVHPIVDPPETFSRPLRRFPLHPSFGWAILWCVAMEALTQIPGGLVAGLYIVIVLLVAPEAFNTPTDGGIAELMANPNVQVALGIGLWMAHFLLILMSLLMLRILAGRDWHREVALRLPSLSHFGLILVLTPAFILLANFVFYVLHDRLRIPSFLTPKTVEGMPDMEKLFQSWPLAVAVFLIGVMPGVSEELWCRAFLGRGLVGIHGYVAGVLMTSFLFGLIHVDPCQGGMAAVLGVVLHYVYLMTRSLLAPMLLHFLNNASSVVLSQYDQIERAMQPDQLPVFVYVATALMLIGVGFALYQSRARLVTPGDGIPWTPPYPGVACPPPGSNTIVHAPLPSLASVFVVTLALVAFVAAIVVRFQRM